MLMWDENTLTDFAHRVYVTVLPEVLHHKFGEQCTTQGSVQDHCSASGSNTIAFRLMGFTHQSIRCWTDV